MNGEAIGYDLFGESEKEMFTATSQVELGDYNSAVETLGSIIELGKLDGSRSEAFNALALSKGEWGERTFVEEKKFDEEEMELDGPDTTTVADENNSFSDASTRKSVS